MAKLPRDTIYHYEYDGKDNINITITDLIRCRDCEHWDTSWKPTTSSGKSHYCALKDGVWEPNDYCSSAERRGEEEWVNLKENDI